MNFNSIFEELSKLYEEAPKAIAKETDQLCSVVFDGEQQLYTGTRKECEDWIKAKGGSTANRMSIKNSATVVMQETCAEEGCEKEALKEAADDEIEIVDDEMPVEEKPAEEATDEETPEEDVDTVKEFLDSVGEYDGDLKLEFKPIVIDGKEYKVVGLLWDDTIEEGKLVAEVEVEMSEDVEVDEEPVEEALSEALITLQNAEAENDFINNSEHRWVEKFNAAIANTQFPAIVLKVQQEHVGDADEFTIRNGELVATFTPVGARVARVTRVVGGNTADVDEIVIEVRNRRLTKDVFNNEPRSYYVHLTDLYNNVNPIINNTPRRVTDADIKGYIAASISEGRVLTSSLMDVLREFARTKNDAYAARRGNSAAARAVRLIDIIKEEDKDIVRDWIKSHAVKVDFVVPYGDVSDSFPELDDYKLANAFTKKLDRSRANFFSAFGLNETEYKEGEDTTIGHNVYLRWRYAGANSEGMPAEKSIHFFNKWFVTATMYFDTFLDSAPEAAITMMQEAKARSKDDKAKYDGTAEFISSTVFCLAVIRDLFGGNLDFLA